MNLINAKRLMLSLSSLFLFSLLFIACSEENPINEEIVQESIETEVTAKHALSGFKTRQGWADSFAYKGKCYCKSTYDHKIGKIKVKGKTVRSICEKMKKDMKKALKQAKGKVIWYNTVQCGHWPWHTDKTVKGQKDEVLCPGRVGNNIKCNTQKGPKWAGKYLK